MSFQEYFAYGVTMANLPAFSVNPIYSEGNIRMDSDADFEIHKLTYFASFGNIRIRMRNDAYGGYFIRDATDLKDIAGNFAGSPFVLPQSFNMKAGTNTILEVADISGNLNNLRFTMQGAKIRPGVAPWDKKFSKVVGFPYTTRKFTVGALATATVQVAVDNDANFLVKRITGNCYGDCLIDIKEGARDRDWFNSMLHFNTVIGNGQFPNILFANRFIYRGSVISVTVQDLTGVPNEVEVVFHGSKMYE